MSSWGEPGKGGPNEFHLPHSLVVGHDGRIYLCDRENSRIQVFSAEGEYITMWTDMQLMDDHQVSKETFDAALAIPLGFSHSRWRPTILTTVGAGKFTYTYIQDWAKMPAG